MPSPELQEVFKTGGIPTFTFVKPKEYPQLILNLRTPGRGLVVEGPSGIGKTTAVENAVEDAGLGHKVTKLSARRQDDVEYIMSLPTLGDDVGTVIVDDFHKLNREVQEQIADYLKVLADRELETAKIIVVGINKAGDRLIKLAADLVNRMDVIEFESNPDRYVEMLIAQGEKALNIEFNVKSEIVDASSGSFYLAQMLCREVCLKAEVLEACIDPTTLEVSFEAVSAEVWDRLDRLFRERCERFCRGSRLRRAGRAPYLHILRWLAQGSEWSLSVTDALRQHPEMKGSVGQVVSKGYLFELIASDEELDSVLHFDPDSANLSVEDPQFVYYIRNISWVQFAQSIGFTALEFKHLYDFALSFAGSDRNVAKALFEALQEAELEVFYDKNEQHRILAEDVEEYLKPIYRSEAEYVIVLMGPDYPKRIWTKFESEQFKDRFGEGSIIPIWFDTAPAGLFDESLRYGGMTLKQGEPLEPQIKEISGMLVAKIEESRKAV